MYRQSSQHSAGAAAEVDADNRYLSRMNTLRLDAESVRDAMLKLSGQLNPQMGGPPVKQFLEVKASGSRPEADYQHFDVDNPANNRRSIYRFIFRTMPDPLMSRRSIVRTERSWCRRETYRSQRYRPWRW